MCTPGGPTGGIAIAAAARVANIGGPDLDRAQRTVREPGTRLRIATWLKERLFHAVVTLSARNAEQRRTWLREPRNFVGIPPGSA
jgi:hypothetical protein